MGEAGAGSAESEDEKEPWVLRLGNYLSTSEPAPEAGTGWAVRLGSYLKEKQPGPWSIIANKKPQDPLALRLGTFLNETKPLGLLHSAEGAEADEAAADPIVVRGQTGAELPATTRQITEPARSPLPQLRLGNYLNGDPPGTCSHRRARVASILRSLRARHAAPQERRPTKGPNLWQPLQLQQRLPPRRRRATRRMRTQMRVRRRAMPMRRRLRPLSRRPKWPKRRPLLSPSPWRRRLEQPAREPSRCRPRCPTAAARASAVFAGSRFSRLGPRGLPRAGANPHAQRAERRREPRQRAPTRDVSSRRWTRSARFQSRRCGRCCTPCFTRCAILRFFRPTIHFLVTSKPHRHPHPWPRRQLWAQSTARPDPPFLPAFEGRPIWPFVWL
jgi:hypothetical protein